jgi:NADH dehydrogenase
MTFEGIPAECYGRGKRMITDAYNKVNGTKIFTPLRYSITTNR